MNLAVVTRRAVGRGGEGTYTDLDRGLWQLKPESHQASRVLLFCQEVQPWAPVERHFDPVFGFVIFLHHHRNHLIKRTK
jgi:hypothetical protein